MSFTEFSYQLVQGDRLPAWLYQQQGLPACSWAVSDQWGNITTGTELIRRMEGAGEAFAHDVPADHQGRRRRSSARPSRGNVWLDPQLHVAVQVLPVLAQRERRGRRALRQDIHDARPRDDRGSRRRSPRGAASARIAESAGPRGDLHGARRGGVPPGRRGFGNPVRRRDGRGAARHRRADVPAGVRRRDPVSKYRAR